LKIRLIRVPKKNQRKSAFENPLNPRSKKNQRKSAFENPLNPRSKKKSA
jgi:hypothetical protein